MSLTIKQRISNVLKAVGVGLAAVVDLGIMFDVLDWTVDQVAAVNLAFPAVGWGVAAIVTLGGVTSD
jgi:hypothetical protein